MKRVHKSPHGTVSRYQHYGCRCPKCTSTNREASRNFRKKAGILGGVGPGYDGTPEWDQMDLDLLLEPNTRARLYPDVLYDLLLS